MSQSVRGTLLVMVAFLIIAALVLDLLLFGPASHALDPNLPTLFRVD